MSGNSEGRDPRPGAVVSSPVDAFAALHWVDGQLVGVEDSARLAPANEPSCYSTARVTNGVPHLQRQHVERIQRDAVRLGLESVDSDVILEAFRALGREAFGGADGIVRVRVLRSPEGRVRVCADSRPIGDERDAWCGIAAPFPHTGPDSFSGVKLMNRDLYARAHDYTAIAGVDETLLFNADGLLVEGARSNILIVNDAGELIGPDLALGAVRGIAHEVLRERVPELETRPVRVHDVCDAREVIATNAVRGARPITQLGHISIADGQPGPWARRLDQVLAEA